MYNPIITPRQSKYGNNFWTAYGQKVDREVTLYSDLEYDHWIMLEMNPNIESYCEQPARISFIYNEIKKESVFDMWIRKKDRTECMIEVKYSDELDPNNSHNKRTLLQIEAQSEWCKQEGIPYQVATERDIRSNYLLLQNNKRLLAYANCMNSSESALVTVLSCLDQYPMSITEIVRSTPDINSVEIMKCIAKLSHMGEISIDLTKKYFSFESQVMKL